MTQDEFLDLLETIAVRTVWIPIIVGVICFRKSSSGLRAIIALMLVSTIVDELIGIYQDKAWFSLYPLRLFTFIEFSLLTYYFISITSRRKWRIVMRLMLVPFFIVCLIDLNMNGVLQRDDLAVSTEGVVMLLYSLGSLYFILKDTEHPNILATSKFWIISAVLIYFGGNIFVFALYNFGDKQAQALVWGMHSLICIMYYLLIAKGLWKVRTSH